MAALDSSKVVAVVGAGTMGSGIAQVAASAGHSVILFDAAPGAAEVVRERISKGLLALAAKGKMAAEEAETIAGRIRVADGLQTLAPAALVIEAIVERLDAKQALFSELEGIVAADAILATNTSSISVTAIGAALQRPERLAGMHFFNPAPVMKLVEVVSGLSTDGRVAEIILDTAKAWGKVAVPTKSTPGFIVNRVARAFYGEPLRLCEEGVADPVTFDALFTEGAGFRMGPFTLMDMIGHDINHAVSRQVFEGYSYEPRFRPSQVQAELVAAGWLGRKSGRGFYDYRAEATVPQPRTSEAPAGARAWETLKFNGWEERDGVLVCLTDGREAREIARETGKPVIVIDYVAQQVFRRVGFACSPEVSEEQKASFLATASAQGLAATELPDWPGLVILRTISMIANEGFEAVLQGVAGEAGIDAAMRFGVNYPKGPIEWAREIGLQRILAVLDAVYQKTGDPRYRASLALRKAAAEA